MNTEKKPMGTPVQPSLTEMFARFMERQAEAQAAGVAATETGEVVPFEAVPVQPVDARLAWDEAKSALALFSTKKLPSVKAPADWSNLVLAHEPTAAIALACGNFPQLVRDLHLLTQAHELGELRPNSARSLPGPNLGAWADDVLGAGKFPQTMLAVGALRLARQFDAAQQRIERCESQVPTEWRAAWDNERAALAWHRGNANEAAALWQKLPESIPVLFNRGMAALFLGRSSDARPSLAKAVAQLPEENAWHHLGRLYLALAEFRR